MDKDKNIKKQNNAMTIEDLEKREVWFSKVSFKYDKAKSLLNKDSDKKSVFFDMPLQVSIDWGLVAKKQDNKGIIIGCNFKIKSEIFDINFIIKTKMEFKKIITDKQLYKDCFFQILAAQIYFPYMIELVAVNTSSMDRHISPIILENELLQVVIQETTKKGPLSKLPN